MRSATQGKNNATEGSNASVYLLVLFQKQEFCDDLIDTLLTGRLSSLTRRR